MVFKWGIARRLGPSSSSWLNQSGPPASPTLLLLLPCSNLHTRAAPDRRVTLHASNALIAGLGRSGRLLEARQVFDGLGRRDAVSWNAIIAAYAKSGHLEDAETLFKRMPSPDIVSWTTMITAYARRSQGGAAMEIFQRMEMEGPREIDYVCFVSLLGACDRLRYGKRIHACLLDDTAEMNVVLWTALVSMYGSFLQSVDDARRVFDGMLNRNVVSWNAMITAYAQNGEGIHALELFGRMRFEGVAPNRVTFISALDACSTLANLKRGKAVHACLNCHQELKSDIAIQNALVNMYGKCKNPSDAQIIFERMPRQDIVSWTTMIVVCAQNSIEKASLGLFHEMVLQGVKPNNVTFTSILEACANLEAIDQGKRVHASIVAQSGFKMDIFVGTALVNMYGKCGRSECARAAFDAMPCRDAVSWNSMIAAYCQNGYGNASLELFRWMCREGVNPNKVTFVSMLDSCVILRNLEHGKVIHAYIVNNELELDLVVGNAIVNMYGKCGRVVEARTIFGKIPRPNVVSCNAMIAAYAQYGQTKRALELFQLLDSSTTHMKPDKITFITILDSCCTTIDLKYGKMLHASITRSGFESDMVVGNALVNMYGKCGSLGEAKSLFERMAPINVVSWNSILTAYAQNGKGKEALELFQTMDRKGVNPNSITFISILSACSHAGLLDDGWVCFKSMFANHGIIPSVDHYACMVDLIGRMGQLDKAEDLISQMAFEPSFEPHVVGWISFLVGCKNHGDAERGAIAAEHSLALNPRNCSSQALLSIPTRRWEDSKIDVKSGCDEAVVDHLFASQI